MITPKLITKKDNLQSANLNEPKHKRSRDASPIEEEINLSEQFQKLRKIGEQPYQHDSLMDHKIRLETIKSFPAQIFNANEYSNRDKISSPKQDKLSPREDLENKKKIIPPNIKKFINNMVPHSKDRGKNNIAKLISKLKLPSSKNFSENLDQMRKLGLHQEKQIEDHIINNKILMKSSSSPNSPLIVCSPFMTHSPTEYSPRDNNYSPPYDSEEVVMTFDDAPIDKNIFQKLNDLPSPKMTSGNRIDLYIYIDIIIESETIYQNIARDIQSGHTLNPNTYNPMVLSPKINSFPFIQNESSNKLNKDTISEFQQQKINPNTNIPTAYIMTRNLGKELVNNQINKISLLMSAKNDPAKVNSTGQYNVNYISNTSIPHMVPTPDIYKNEQNLTPLMSNFIKMNLNSTSPKNRGEPILPIFPAINQNQGGTFSNTRYHPSNPVLIQNQPLNAFCAPTTASNLHGAQNQINQNFTHLNDQNMNLDR